MSAYISLVLPEGGFLFTDGASYDRSGRIAAFTNKTYLVEGEPVAFTSRGNALVADLILTPMMKMVERSGTEALLENMPFILRQFATMDMPDFQGPNMAEIAFVAWTEEGPIHRYFLTDRRLYDDGSVRDEAYRLYEPKALNVSGSALLPEDMQGVPSRTGRTDVEFARALSMHLMERMRLRPGAGCGMTNGEPVHLIGGHVDMTTVTAAGAVTERIRVWSDRVGQMIDPAQASNVVPMTRQQRRAAERIATKARA